MEIRKRGEGVGEVARDRKSVSLERKRNKGRDKEGERRRGLAD